MTDPIREGKRVPITNGMANAMVRYGAARQCPDCQFAIPKYPGRYPGKCPRCGCEMCGTKNESLQERRGYGWAWERGDWHDQIRALLRQGRRDEVRAAFKRAGITPPTFYKSPVETKRERGGNWRISPRDWGEWDRDVEYEVKQKLDMAFYLADDDEDPIGDLIRELRKLKPQRESVNESADSELKELFKHHDTFWQEYIRRDGDYDPHPHFANLTQGMLLKQVESALRRIINKVSTLDNKKVNRKIDAIQRWWGRGKYRKANDAYWMMRSELKKAGLLEAAWGTGAHAVTTDDAGEGFWGNAGAGVLPIAQSTGRILIGLRSRYVNEPGTWGVFGGAIDSGERPENAARREMLEELGCCRQLKIIPAYVFTSPGGGFRFSNFIGLVDDEFEPRLDWETETTKWVTFDELLRHPKKHFGLEALLKNSKSLIQRHAQPLRESYTTDVSPIVNAMLDMSGNFMPQDRRQVRSNITHILPYHSDLIDRMLMARAHPEKIAAAVLDAEHERSGVWLGEGKKPNKGKKWRTKCGGKEVSHGDPNAKIAPGTPRGDAYCARSAKIKDSGSCSPNALSRKKWRCRGSKSMKEGAAPVVCVSNTHRIQKLIEGGQQSFNNYMNDPSCSRVVTIRYDALAESGGAHGIKAWTEGPTNGYHYRVEGIDEPVLLFQFDESAQRVRVFASQDPGRYLHTDPRDSIVSEDHEVTFDSYEGGILDEGLLQRAAEMAQTALRKKFGKMRSAMGALRDFKRMWDEAQRETGLKPKTTSAMRMAMGLESEVKAALAGVRESHEPIEEEQIDEALGVTTVIGFVLAIIGGMPMLLRALARAAKWAKLTRLHKALKHAAHVAHEIETGVIDWIVPSELSHAVYRKMYKRGFRIGSLPGRTRIKAEEDGPMSLDQWMADSNARETFESGIYRVILVYFAISGFIALLHAPLGALFAAEAAATGVKGVEIGQGLKNAAKLALEGVVDNPNVKMVVVEDHGLIEDADTSTFRGVQFFVTEGDASGAASRLGLDLTPSLRNIGGEKLWILVHEDTGYALGRGEVRRLDEFFGSGPGAPTYRAATAGPEAARARHRAVDHTHDRVAGAFAEDYRSSMRRPRKPGEGRTRVQGGFRFHVGKNQERKPRKDVSRSLQNKHNATRPGASREKIKGLKKWHRSRDGKKFHRELNSYNRQNNEAAEHDAALRAKVLDVKDRILRYNAGQQRQPGPRPVYEDIGVLRPRSSGGTEQMSAMDPSRMNDRTPDDVLEGILRRLIVTQNMDVLQDVEFDEDTGSVYLFFDPMLQADEVYEIMSAMRQERGDLDLIASPDMSLPGEAVESEWWVFFLPGSDEGMQPDPMIYAKEPDQHGTKIQAVVMAQPNTPEALAQGLDVGAVLKSAGS